MGVTTQVDNWPLNLLLLSTVEKQFIVKLPLPNNIGSSPLASTQIRHWTEK